MRIIFNIIFPLFLNSCDYSKAEVLWKMGRIDEALIEIKKCLVFSPDDKYYKEQFEKFNKKNI
ncbi:MAG: hypothetical protein CMG55_10255 [Candidatus Marinimicrobia bacterium]|nr:hypothetical protein [Candidatus Neomarinimicrobiota bacterium]|tara:strand:- start:1730 stop:1918 length:189 start_codon:yes stop_codon:yes gene_type:complete